MANISSAIGSMMLKGPWTSTLITHLNTIASEIWANWCYNIQLDAFDINETKNEQSVAFFGGGRWAFCNNLEYLGRWTADEVRVRPEFHAVYAELTTGMQANGLTIAVSYSDEESGCLVLYRQTGVLSFDGEMLSYMVTSEEGLDYNWDNYMDVTGDVVEFDLLIESLCEQLGLENDEAGLVERWAAARTYPHYMQFDEIGADAQAEFKEVFLTMPSSDELDVYLSFVEIARKFDVKRLIKAPVGAELVNFGIDTVVTYRDQDLKPQGPVYDDFVVKSLIDKYGL